MNFNREVRKYFGSVHQVLGAALRAHVLASEHLAAMFNEPVSMLMARQLRVYYIELLKDVA